MRVTKNIFHSATSVLELFKFVTSLALVSAVSVALGVIGLSGVTNQVSSLNKGLMLVAFIFLLIRYYHGNSLHLLESYEEGNPSRNVSIALPADAFFIILQGIVLTALSFTILNLELFSILLFALLVIDAIWAGTLVRLNKDPTQKYLLEWFLLNFIGAIVLAVGYLLVSDSSIEIQVQSIFIFILLHTIYDYWRNWPRYFPPPVERTLMIGAPLTAKIIDDAWSDPELKECIVRAYYLCKQNDYAVYSAHIIEEFGAKLRKLGSYVVADVREAKDSAVYIGITDGTASNGLAVEVGIAAASGTEIHLYVRDTSENLAFLEELVRAHKGSLESYGTPDELIEKIKKKLKLTKGEDPGKFFNSTDGYGREIR